jgi:hypothetical protein
MHGGEYDSLVGRDGLGYCGKAEQLLDPWGFQRHFHDGPLLPIGWGAGKYWSLWPRKYLGV